MPQRPAIVELFPTPCAHCFLKVGECLSQRAITKFGAVRLGLPYRSLPMLRSRWTECWSSEKCTGQLHSIQKCLVSALTFKWRHRVCCITPIRVTRDAALCLSDIFRRSPAFRHARSYAGYPVRFWILVDDISSGTGSTQEPQRLTASEKVLPGRPLPAQLPFLLKSGKRAATSKEEQLPCCFV